MIPELLKKIDQVPLWSDRFYCSPPEATPKGVSLVFGNNAKLYQATAISGPGAAAGPQDPVASSGYWLALINGAYKQIYTTSGVHIFTAPCSGWYEVWVIGGGGGSGGMKATSATTSYIASGGGGAGGGAIKRVYLNAGEQVTVTVGAGGAAGLAGGKAGDGGSSSFGAYCSASGGTGSNGVEITATSSHAQIGGPGGIGSGGDINVCGSTGVNAHNIRRDIAYRQFPGSGGASPFIGHQPNINSQPRATYYLDPVEGALGSGASGCGLLDITTASLAGAKGGDGVVIVNFIGGGNE